MTIPLLKCHGSLDPTAWSSRTRLRQILWLVGPPSAKNNRASWWLSHPSEKYARQIGSFPQVRMKIKNIWNHHLAGSFWGILKKKKERTKVCYGNLVWFFLVEDGYESKPAFLWGNTRDRLQSCSLHRNEFGPSDREPAEPSSPFIHLFPQDPWDWYIFLHLVAFYGFHVGKYTIHAPYGICIYSIYICRKQNDINIFAPKKYLGRCTGPHCIPLHLSSEKSRWDVWYLETLWTPLHPSFLCLNS